MDGPSDLGYECTFECDSGTGDEGMGPTVHVFTNIDIPNFRNSGSREIMTVVGTFFDPNPQLLDDGGWDDEHRELQDGLSLHSCEM